MRLSERKKTAVLREFESCGDCGAVAKKLKLSLSTVQKTVSERITDSCSISKYMENKNGEICRLIDTYLAVLSDAQRIDSAPLNQIASALGTVIDRFTKTGSAGSDNGQLEKLISALKK